MNHPLRSLAPISDSGWKLLDDESSARLAPALGARKLVDFSGRRGWRYSATNLGRTRPATSAPCEGVTGVQRRVLPLVEMRADFDVSLAELGDADRGAVDAELEALDTAAHQIAVAENIAVFHGWHAAIAGIADSSPHTAMPLGDTRTPTRGRSRVLLGGFCTSGSPAPTRSRSGASDPEAWWRRQSVVAIRCWTICARSWRVRSSGHPV